MNPDTTTALDVGNFSDEDLCDVAVDTLDDAPFVVVVVSVPDYRYLFLNKAALALMEAAGIGDPPDALGKHPWDYFDGWRDVFFTVYEKTRKTGEAQVLDGFEYPGPGCTAYWDITLIPNKNEADEVTSISAIGFDVTERVEAQQQLADLVRQNRDQREFLQELIQASPIGIAVVSKPDCRYELANPAYRTIPGTPDMDMVGRTIYEVFPEAAEAVRVNLDKAFETGRTASLREVEASVGPGRECTYWDIDTIPLDDSEGNISSVLILTREVTERVLTEKALYRAAGRLSSVLESITDGYYALDSEWRFVEMNRVAEQHFGRSSEELIGKNIWEQTRIPSDSVQYRKFHEAVERQQPVHFEACSRIRTDFWAELHLYPRDGRLEVYFRDISRRKLAEEALRESEQRYRSLFESSLDAVMLTVPDGRITTANPAAREMFGMTEEEICRAGRQGLIDSDDPRVAPLVAERARTGQVRGVVTFVRKNGSKFEGEFTSVVLDPGERAFVIVRDITERVRAEEALHNQVHDLQRALLPTEPVVGPGYELASVYLPAYAEHGEEIGGDFYDVFPTEAGKVGILIGDVSGKGIEAASLASATRNTVRAFGYDMSSPAYALSHANSVLSREQVAFGRFVTTFLIILDPETGNLRYSSAGHPPAVIQRADGGIEMLSTGELPIAVLGKVEYGESESALGPGDRIILYTDGVTEARRGANLFGVEGLGKVILDHSEQSPDDLVGSIVSAATEWARGCLRDDTAIIVVERQAAARGQTGPSTT